MRSIYPERMQSVLNSWHRMQQDWWHFKNGVGTGYSPKLMVPPMLAKSKRWGASSRVASCNKPKKHVDTLAFTCPISSYSSQIDWIHRLLDSYAFLLTPSHSFTLLSYFSNTRCLIFSLLLLCLTLKLEIVFSLALFLLTFLEACRGHQARSTLYLDVSFCL